MPMLVSERGVLAKGEIFRGLARLLLPVLGQADLHKRKPRSDDRLL
jgi:hypothetical protein